jgi:histone demethylase JARID1
MLTPSYCPLFEILLRILALVLQELVDKVVAFQDEAQTALSAKVPESRQLEKLIDIGITLDVDLPEIPRLKQVTTV